MFQAIFLDSPKWLFEELQTFQPPVAGLDVVHLTFLVNGCTSLSTR